MPKEYFDERIEGEERGRESRSWEKVGLLIGLRTLIPLGWECVLGWKEPSPILLSGGPVL